ncbi:hypothetical protein [Glaciecola sp. MF2-115]|uniref:hypothetical protein n=1 Tax=Glaciecola sp. MF2-115 TaxID=3384827 RepID=UPI0039A060C4
MKYQKEVTLVSILLGLLGSTSALAESKLCIPYLEDKQMVAALDIADREISQKAKLALDTYLNAAKMPVANVLSTLTKLDNSQSFATGQLKQIPDLYSSYSGIKGYEMQQAYHWGNYVMFYTQYKHTNGAAQLLDSALCTNLCQMSNAMERPNEVEDLASRYFQYVRLSKDKAYKCDSPGQQIVSINPTVQLNKSHPLEVALNVTFTRIPLSNPFQIGWGQKAPTVKGKEENVSKCELVSKTLFKDLINADKARDILPEEQAQFLSACTVNMKTQSVVPMINLSSRTRELVALVPFGQMLADATSTDLVAKFEGKTHDIFVLELSNLGTHLVTLPMLKTNQGYLLDWQQYGTASGEILTTAPFAKAYTSLKKK